MFSSSTKDEFKETTLKDLGGDIGKLSNLELDLMKKIKEVRKLLGNKKRVVVEKPRKPVIRFMSSTQGDGEYGDLFEELEKGEDGEEEEEVLVTNPGSVKYRSVKGMYQTLRLEHFLRGLSPPPVEDVIGVQYFPVTPGGQMTAKDRIAGSSLVKAVASSVPLSISKEVQITYKKVQGTPLWVNKEADVRPQGETYAQIIAAYEYAKSVRTSNDLDRDIYFTFIDEINQVFPALGGNSCGFALVGSLLGWPTAGQALSGALVPKGDGRAKIVGVGMIPYKLIRSAEDTVPLIVAYSEKEIPALTRLSSKFLITGRTFSAAGILSTTRKMVDCVIVDSVASLALAVLQTSVVMTRVKVGTKQIAPQQVINITPKTNKSKKNTAAKRAKRAELFSDKDWSDVKDEFADVGMSGFLEKYIAGYRYNHIEGKYEKDAQALATDPKFFIGGMTKEKRDGFLKTALSAATASEKKRQAYLKAVAAKGVKTSKKLFKNTKKRRTAQIDVNPIDLGLL
jgi:hypothetical protein